MRKSPTTKRERYWYQHGARVVVGVDEAGAGALAGPVVAGAAYLPPGVRLRGIRDSKMLSPAARELAYVSLEKVGAVLAHGLATVEEIAALGIRAANLEAMRRAVVALGMKPDVLLVDWYTIPGFTCPQESVARADQHILSVAAASIVAKVTRDRMMVALDAEYPGYGFAVHKGYGTVAHRESLLAHGPSLVHRRAFLSEKFLQN